MMAAVNLMKGVLEFAAGADVICDQVMVGDVWV